MQVATKPAPPRVLSIDVLRGLTIALMILVNDPGDWGHVYTQLDHAEWNGFTLTDFVFPNFLFIVGISIVLSIQARLGKGASKRSLAMHMFRRAAIIFIVKLLLSAYPHFHLAHLRIFGVLTRIAICYLIAGLVCLAVWNVSRRRRILVATTAVLLVGYWALMRFVPVPLAPAPGFGVPTHQIPILDPNYNLAAWIDRCFNAFTQRWLHTGSLYNHTRDPEGLLSTLPAIATAIIGCLAGLGLVNARANASSTAPKSTPTPGTISSLVMGLPDTTVRTTRYLRVLLLAGFIFVTVGMFWNDTFPINKNLWTSSYVLYSAGWSLLLLALFYWFIDIRRLNQKPVGKALLWPWLVFGSNAITAYILSNLFVETLLWIKVPASHMHDPDTPHMPVTAWFWFYHHFFAPFHSTNVRSLAFAVAFTAVCFLPNWFLWRRKIFLKI